MSEVQENAYKFGCGRFVQRHGAVEDAGIEAARLGKRAMILSGSRAYPLLGEKLEASLRGEGIGFERVVHSGPCNREVAKAQAQQANEMQAEMIIGVGGGVIMDQAKLVACNAGLPVMNVPTSSATCAAYTPLSVYYTPQGACLGSVFFSSPVSCVLCDMDILCRQPRRLMLAGMLDAMAKQVEVEYYAETGMAFHADARAARTLAKLVYQTFAREGEEMLAALDTPGAGQAVTDAAYLAIAVTGMISGIARGRYQAALGHAFYEDIRTCQGERSMKRVHGELVGLGLLIQETFLGHDARAQELKTWMQNHGACCTLRELGLDDSPEALEALANARACRQYIGDEKQRYIEAIRAHCV